MKLTDELLREVDIDEQDIELEMQRQPAKFCFWGARYVRATRRHAREKLALKELKARIAKDYRTYMKEKDPQVRVTEAMVDTFVTLTPELKDQERVAIEADYQENLLNVAREAFRQRAQLLLQICRHQMDEMIQSDFKINKKEMEGRHEEYEKRHLDAGILGGKKSGPGDREPKPTTL